MTVDVCFSPALYPYYAGDADKVVVVTDIFRASTTMCAALNNGASSVIPVASIEEAKAYKEKGYLVGAERNVKRCDFADFGNSPFDYTPEKVGEKDIVFTTTNGTQAIEQAKDASELIIGAFVNIRATLDFCLEQGKDVIILCAGWNNRFNMEDTLFGGALAAVLKFKGWQSASDASLIAMQMWREAKNDIRKYVGQSEHIKRLESNGLLKDADYCLTLDAIDIVPVYDKANKKLVPYG
ncbi:2-phosphosulfolactate phosphatase [Dysgonomonas sp. 25]|uniref:2-phosphosulfolactate phosphatase n=1 Tax=Dysgonomonas sp. 25 TaxID=2302933 RepID=UPI0013D83BE4|nr:2-phosphosulfolactate phosphatase [Dysgonomonas sp. 25]NDV68469.1 2-phosphosulfolactate phosphatase [Dysgonomonas sp. 25]